MVAKCKKLGKREPLHLDYFVKLNDYIKKALPKSPQSVQWSKAVPTDKWGMFLNDEEGDCTFAASGHQIQCWTANTGSMLTVADTSIQKGYEDVGGYIPGDESTDNGAYCTQVLEYRQFTGIEGHKILGFVLLELDNQEEIQGACNIFGGLYGGVALPKTAQRQNDKHQRWTVTSKRGNGSRGSWGGHCVYIPDYDSLGPTCITWSEKQAMSWQFFHYYFDEIYAAVTLDWINANSHLCPIGLDINSLVTDLHSLLA